MEAPLLLLAKLLNFKLTPPPPARFCFYLVEKRKKHTEKKKKERAYARRREGTSYICPKKKTRRLSVSLNISLYLFYISLMKVFTYTDTNKHVSIWQSFLSIKPPCVFILLLLLLLLLLMMVSGVNSTTHMDINKKKASAHTS
jgi:hypothetical protein